MMRIAVTAANGSMGRRIVQLLATGTDHEVVAVTRRPFDGPELPNVATELADYSDASALQRAFDAVDTLIFISSDGPAANVILHHQNIVTAAEAAGIRQVAALSSIDADLASPFCYAVTNGRTEQLLEESDMAHSVVRASIFGEFFSTAFLAKAKVTGEIRIPAADAGIALVSRDDVADALAMRALLGPSAAPTDITGPEALDGRAVAAIANDVWNRPVKYVEVPPERFALDLTCDGMDPWWTYAFVSMFESIRQRRWETVSGEVEALTGRPAMPLSAILRLVD